MRYSSWPHVSAVMAITMLPALVSATPPVLPRAGPAPRVWVTVDDNGSATTITPTVTGSSTISAPPSSLTQTGVYTLKPGALTLTSTGLPPVASPTGSGSAGSFLTCNNYQDDGSPICQPRRGSQLVQGKTYYVVWDPSFFSGTPDADVEVQVDYGGGRGVTTKPHTMSASKGFYIWTLDANLLQKSSANANVSLYLAYNGSSGLLPVPRGGLALAIISAPPTSSGVSILAIVLPIVLVLALLGLLGFCFWSWKRHGHLPFIGALTKRRQSQGYGIRKSHSQRTGMGGSSAGDQGVGQGRKGGANIQLTPRESWSPTQGRNVFRDEISRQDRDPR